MEYQDNDFKNMFLNVWKSEGDLFKAFPILTKYPEFKAKLRNIDKNKVIKYIAYAFDKNSPLMSVMDIMERRFHALELAKFPKDIKGNYSSQTEQMVHSGIPEINRMVIRYCLFTGDSEYAILTTYEDSLIKELKNLMDFDNPIRVKKGKSGESDQVSYNEPTDKKAVIISNIAKLKQLIKELKQEIFSNNIDAFLLRSLMEFTESNRFEFSPEFFAAQTKEWNNISRYYGGK